ncbi:MAG TPA: BatD family protein, partial [Terriglobales bacterium]|nr:BatD family protein [Terriglobales bacterium]
MVILLLLLLLVLPASPLQAEVSVRASVNPSRAHVGQTVALAIEIQNAQGVQAPALQNLDGFEARYIGPSTQMSIVNGQVSSSITHRYALTAEREGVFQLGPFSVEHAGTTYRTNAVQVAVSAAPEGGAGAGGARGDAMRLMLSTARESVYVHERLPIEVTLYVRGTRVSDIAFPTLSAPGLSIEPFGQPDRGTDQLDGLTYEVLRFKTFVVPLQAGPRSLGPAALRLNVVTQGSGFFMSQKRPVDLQSNQVPLEVKALPQAGRPADFAGAVGRFTLEVTAAPTDVLAGDPITLKMMLRGEGNLTDAQPPRLSERSGFRVYDPQPAQGEAQGVRLFEQVIIPESAEVKVLPPVRFSYFDVGAGEYRTLTSAAIPLNVRARAENVAPQIVTAPGQEPAPQEETLGTDIVSIKDGLGRLIHRDRPWYGSGWVWLWLPLPALLLLGATLYDRQRTRLTGDLRYARYAGAGKVARAGLAEAEASLRAGQVEQCYDVLSRTVREYLAAKLDLPVGAVDANSVAGRGVQGAELEQVAAFFDAFEQARYTGRSHAADAEALLGKARQIIDALERRKAKTSLFALLLVVLAMPAMAAEGPQSSFFAGNSAYAAGRYEEARQAYEAVLRSGWESAAVRFNLGNSYFKLGRKGLAIVHYERAAQLAPRDPDIEANLSFARSATGADDCRPLWWQRLAFPLATRFTSAGLLQSALLLLTAALLLLTAYKLLATRPRLLLYLAGGCGVATVVVASSLAF